jgi:hypothetical protein
MQKILFVFAFLIFHFTLLHAQTNPHTINQEEPQISEEMKQSMEMQTEAGLAEDADYSVLLENKTYSLSHPIRLNNASREELEESGLFSDIQVNNLITYMKKNGKLISIYELQAIPGFDLPEIRTLFKHLCIDSYTAEAKVPILSQMHAGAHTITGRAGRIVELQKGYTSHAQSSSSHYVGNPWKMFLAYRFSAASVSWSLCGQKDAGEEFFKGSQKRGFDFYSGHLVIKDKGILKTCVVGDYSVGLGQGLIAWSGISFSKTSDASIIKKNASGIKPYTSTNENSFMRGAAATFQLGSLGSCLFFSRKKIDASVTDTNASGQPLQVRTLETSGLHATKSQLSSRHSLGQTVAGANMCFALHSFRLGVSFLETQFDAALVPRPELYNRFDFKGRNLSTVGLDYNWVFRNVNLFGECAKSSDFQKPYLPGGRAILQGLMIAPDQRISLSLLYRNYERNYHSFYSNAFSEGSKASNEQGFYMGLLLKPCQAITLSAFYDLFVFPWLRYRVNAPSSGSDFFAKLSFSPNKRLEIYTHFRKRVKESDPGASAEEIKFPIAGAQTNYRIHISYAVRPELQIRSRLDLIYASDSLLAKETGYMISQDLIFQNHNSPFSLTLRYALFDTPGSNTRIYAYEHTAPGSFSIPSFSARGSRFNCLIRYRNKRKLEIWLNIGRTFYDSKNTISAGTPDEIDGRHKTEGMIQFRYKLAGKS